MGRYSKAFSIKKQFQSPNCQTCQGQSRTLKKIVFLELFLRIIEDEKWNLFEKLGQLRTPIVGYLPDLWKLGLFSTFNAAKIVLISYLDNIFWLQSHTKSLQSKKSIFTLMGSHIDNSENSIIMSFNDKKIIY